VSVVFCQVEFIATGRSHVQSSPTECGVSECDLETSRMRRPRPTGAVELWKRKSTFKIKRNINSVQPKILYCTLNEKTGK
jgi:hypothetical protein